MCLPRLTAQQVVDAVRNDATCNLNIKSWLRKLPASAGASGTLRNLGYFVMAKDPSDPAIAAQTCTGIAVATVSAIETARKAGQISGIQSVERIDRFGLMPHTATKVTAPDGATYVFDWHATLNPRNPLINYEDEWTRKLAGTPFASFYGLSCLPARPSPLPTPVATP